MDNRNGNLTLQQKTEITNKNIQLYRATNDIKYKKKVSDIVDVDVCKFVRSKFYMFPELYEDIKQEALFIVNKYINSNSSFDPEKDVYIVLYLQKAILSTGRKIIDKMKSPVKYDVKKRQNLVKKLQNIAKENNLESIKEAIPILIEKENPNISDDEFSAYEVEYNNLLNVTICAKIPEDKQDDDNGHYELADENSDFTNNLEEIYEIKRRYHIACILYDKKVISNLQFKTFNIFFLSRLLGREDKKSALAKKLGMTRQNFCRALNEAIKIIEEYIKTHKD